MQKIIFFSFLLLESLLSFAHSPQISTVALVQSEGNKWHLIVSGSLGAYEIELKNNNTNLVLEGLKANEFQRMFIEHLFKKIKITANGEHQGVLKNAKIILGHQTDINFEVDGMPEKLTSLYIEQSGFETLRDHYCILKVITLAKESQNFMLQKNNDYSITLEYKNNIFTEKLSQKNDNWLFIITMITALFASILFIFFKIRKR
jgi:hypothetical protein